MQAASTGSSGDAMLARKQGLVPPVRRAGGVDSGVREKRWRTGPPYLTSAAKFLQREPGGGGVLCACLRRVEEDEGRKARARARARAVQVAEVETFLGCLSALAQISFFFFVFVSTPTGPWACCW